MLVDNLYNTSDLEKRANRDGFGDALVELGAQDERIVALSSDVTESVRVDKFAEQFPNRYFQVGIAEQNMMGIGAGLAAAGKIPFVAAYAVFNPGRNWEQLRVSVAYSKANVKVIGSHAGLTVGPDGATHQALEDIAITRVLPNMTVVVPCDYHEARKATHQLARMEGPTYMRLCRAKSPIFTKEDTHFELGKAEIFREGTDVTIIACGILVYEALTAANLLSKQCISAEVINCHTIKPLDIDTIIKSAKKTGMVITAEEHQVIGGLGSAVAETLSLYYPVRVKRVGMYDCFGESGEPEELMNKYKLNSEGIIKAFLSLQNDR